MSASSPPSPTLGDLQDELILQETLLQSLEYQEDVEKEREEIKRKIQSIEQQIHSMQPQLPDWGSNNGSRLGTNQHSNNGAGALHSPNHTAHGNPNLSNSSPTKMTLPSRKRPRNDFDDEFDILDLPDTKTLRTPTPRTASPARSVDSIDTNVSGERVLRKLLGPDYKEEKANNDRYLKALKLRQQQEEEDAAYARQLHEEWNDDFQSTSSQSKNVNGQPSTYSQSFLRPDGLSFYKKPTVQPENNFKSDDRSKTPALSVSGTSTPNSDDSGLVEISADDWVTRFGPSQRRNLPLTLNNGNSFNNGTRMPGAFPGISNPFASTPGVFVYGNSPYNASQYNSSTSSLSNQFSSLSNNPLLNRGFPGSSRMAFDLDTYPSPSSWSFADPEQTQEEIKDLLKHIRPDEELTPQQLAEVQPEGLKVDLMPHQRKGFAWMKSMEEGTNKGGILADDMGLGKTIQSLALILGRPPPLDDHGRKQRMPTLIVAPVALMQQWEREIEKMIHKKYRLNVLILHGSNRNASWSEIKNYDVVLTTYGLLASDLKRKTVWDKHLKLVPDARPSPQQQCPVLSSNSKFHRVILDEAQNIKNRSTKAAAAACRIQATYRWCLSGTPMQNNVEEIYSLIKFCRIRPYHDLEKFQKDIGRPLKAKGVHLGRDRAMQQLQALLRAVLLRRTKKSEIDGKPILQLPEKNTVEDRTIFSKDELEFYQALETKAQIQFNRYLKAGTIGRNYSNALVLLLRLRQCCCSPQLITNAKDFLVNGALQDLDYVENAKALPQEVVKRLSELDAFECPICMDGVENPIIFNPCGHSLCQECLSTMVDKAMADAESHSVNCPHCRAVIDTNKVTDHESYLRVYFPDRPGVKPLDEDGDENDKEAEAETDDDQDSSEDEVEDDSDDGEDLKDFVVADDEEIGYESDMSDSKPKRLKTEEDDDDFKQFTPSISKSKAKSKKKHSLENKKGKGKGKGKENEKRKSKPDIKTLAQLRKEGLRSRAAKAKYIRRLSRGYQPSSKIEKTIQLLRDIRDNGGEEKTIIFSSFTSFLDLLEVAMSREDEDIDTYTRYDGSMSAKDRNEAVIRFTDDPKCKAILVSLKAGNSGLNLTAANHVIILDPFWNPFVEYQAADRCYRIGQLREVTIHRVLIGEGDEDGNLVDIPEGSERMFTVEDRILALQEKKRELVETALDEAASGNIGRLGVRELGYLFGVNTMDGEAAP